MNKKFLLYFFFILIIISCKKNSTTISGDIPNLPNGKLILYEDLWNNKLDSLEVKDGKFELTHTFDDEIPHYLGIEFYDLEGNKLVFQFPTNSYFNQAKEKWTSSLFLSDKFVKLTDSLEYVDFGENSPFPKNIKTVEIKKIEAGAQTKALQNTNYDLFSRKSSTQYSEIENLLKKYPNSFHLLSEISKNKYQFSSSQVEKFLSLFDKSVQNYPQFKGLQNYIKDSKSINNNKILKLKNSKYKLTEVINKKYKKHLIILWASWCGPCRKEIPILKKIIAENKINGIELISISIDEKESDWRKALHEEQMTWKQLILSKEESENFKIILKYSGAIPYSVLVDNDMKILSSSTGLYDEKEMLKIFNK
ncbi:TlpA disulfide reductase family protein [Chryseobacterium luquanense]|uniref:AhpC/TSA family protein n=1 Tax=Chryseobacterium luquanense TaxID=2983766 RepID=A0ABT3XZ14_9FLAO|nr:TlpA disulfide reductase family protein [Chryseobacterium luquanense]MCX8531130.1 AhpC/TSA family protein [Chryseobacterium luquanense]